MPKKLGPNPDISQLVSDIEKDLIEGKSKVASEIFYRLQYLGPWWTGSFAKSWKIGKTPIKAEKVIKTRFGRRKGRKSQGGDFFRGDNVNGPIPDPRFPRKPVRPRVKIRTPLSEMLYIGNEANYAGFATNLGQTVPVMTSARSAKGNKASRKRDKKYGTESRTYEEHSKYFKITARDPSGAPNPDWFKVYISQSKLLEADISRGLSKVSRRFDNPFASSNV
tara:strand:- start:590 stop:1255 length:666 start_codon:yes stop_codon:yes gene_type:complete